MKTHSKSIFLVIAFALSCGICKSDDPDFLAGKRQKWTSPDKTVSLRIIRTPFVLQNGMPGGPLLISLNAEIMGRSISVTESPLIASPFRREYAGTSWFEDTAPRWVDNRYAIWEYLPDSHGLSSLCIIDAKTGDMMLNTFFEALIDSPEPNTWAAIRYRPVGNHEEERRHGDEKDTLFIINLADMAKASETIRNGSAEPKLFGHLKSTLLPGVALARPLWKTDGNKSRILVGIWNWNKKQAEVLSFDPKTLALQGSANMNLVVPESVILLPWIDHDFEPKVVEAITHSGL